MRHFLIFLLLIAIVIAAVLRLRYGGGEPYADLSTEALLEETLLEEVLAYPEPVGNVAVSDDGRIFFTVHPESRPAGNKLLEWTRDAAVPYPSGSVQPHLFQTVLGLVVDRQNRLWTIDNGNHGFGQPRLIAFDLDTGSIVHDESFVAEVAPAGSFLQDLQVSADGNTVFIADASIWRKNPALIVYDVRTREARRLLDGHEAVSAENYLIRTPARDMTFVGGLLSLKAGADGIAIGPTGKWLYFGAMNNGNLYRVETADLLNTQLAPRQLDTRVERVSPKPLSAAIRTNPEGNIFITDVEHGSIMRVDAGGKLETLIRSPRIRWADGLSFAADGWLYIADSAIPDQILQSREYIEARGPYFIYRFRPDTQGVTNQ